MLIAHSTHSQLGITQDNHKLSDSQISPVFLKQYDKIKFRLHTIVCLMLHIHVVDTTRSKLFQWYTKEPITIKNYTSYVPHRMLTLTCGKFQTLEQ